MCAASSWPNTRTNTRSARNWPGAGTSRGSLYVAALFHDIAKGRGGDHSDARRERDALQLSASQHGIDTRGQPKLIAVPGGRTPHHEPHCPEGRPERPRRHQRFSRQRVGNERYLTALYLLTVADIRGTSAQGVERLERQAAGRPLPLHPAHAGRTRTRTLTPKSRPASGRPWSMLALYALNRSRRTRPCGTRWTWATSCATRPTRSPGTPGC